MHRCSSGALWVRPSVPNRKPLGSSDLLTNQPAPQVSSSSCGSAHRSVAQMLKPRPAWRQSAPPRRRTNPAPRPADSALSPSRRPWIAWAHPGKVVGWRRDHRVYGTLQGSFPSLRITRGRWQRVALHPAPSCLEAAALARHWRGSQEATLDRTMARTLLSTYRYLIQDFGLRLGSLFLLPVPGVMT